MPVDHRSRPRARPHGVHAAAVVTHVEGRARQRGRSLDRTRGAVLPFHAAGLGIERVQVAALGPEVDDAAADDRGRLGAAAELLLPHDAPVVHVEDGELPRQRRDEQTVLPVGRRRRGQLADLVLPLRLARVRIDLVHAAVVAHEVEALPDHDRRKLHQHPAAEDPALLVWRADAGRQVARVRQVVVIDRPVRGARTRPLRRRRRAELDLVAAVHVARAVVQHDERRNRGAHEDDQHHGRQQRPAAPAAALGDEHRHKGSNGSSGKEPVPDRRRRRRGRPCRSANKTGEFPPRCPSIPLT